MATRFWRGAASGNWNSTANWSATSGGPTGASVPTSADDVYFDSNSGNGLSYVTVSTTIKSLNTTGFVGTLNIKTATGTPTTLTVAGNVTLGNLATYSSEGTLRVTSNTTTTLTASNLQIPFNLTFINSSAVLTGKVNLGSNIYLLKTFVMNNYTIALNTFNLSIPSILLYGTTGFDFGSSGAAYIDIYGSNGIIVDTNYLNLTNVFVSGTQKPLIKLSYSGSVGKRSVRSWSNSGALGKFSYEIYGSDTIDWMQSTVANVISVVIDFDATNFTGKFNFLPQYVNGNFSINPASSTLTTSGAGQNITFLTSGTTGLTRNISCNNPAMYIGYTFYSGVTNLLSDIQTTNGVFFNAGTLNLNGYNIKTNTFSAVSNTAAPRILNFNNSTIEIIFNGILSSFQVTAANLTYSGFGTLKATSSNQNATINIDPNSTVIPVNIILNNAGRTNILGSNTFLSLTNTEIGSLVFQATAKNIFSGFSLNGNPTKKYVLGSSSASLNYLGMPSGNANCDYLEIAWSSAAYGNIPNALGYNSVWYAGPNSTVLPGSTVVNWFPKTAGQLLVFFP